MEAIIAHPAKGAKRSPARKQTKASTPAPARPTEAERLQGEALQLLHYLCVELSQTELSRMPNALAEAIECDTVLFTLLNPEESEGPPLGTLDSLSLLRRRVQSTSLCLAEATGSSIPAAVVASVMLDHIDQYAERLHAAISGLPATLEDLRALTTFAGARPFRDRPTPPIRRVERNDDELKGTPVHEAGRTGKMLALQCTWDISVVAEEVAKMGDWIVEADSPATLEGLLRCYGLRIQALNGQVMAYLDGDGTTAGEMHQEIFKGTRPFRGEEE